MSMHSSDTPGLDELTREECLRLTASHSVGRLAVADRGRPPLVVPVNYVLDVDAVVFRSDPGMKVHLARQYPVSFQVDFIDPSHHGGWSVLISGLAVEVEPSEVAHLDLESWVGGAKAHWMRLLASEVSGRRIRLADVPRDPRGYL